jgi:hypothetical protein
LLLVDSDGAKFVAMPTAIEVYNRRVLEAAAGQQARQRSRQALGSAEHAGARPPSSWLDLGERLGFHASNGFMRWLNQRLSTAVALHLIVIAGIILPVTRIRLMVSGGDGDRAGGVRRRSEQRRQRQRPQQPRRTENTSTDNNIGRDNRRPKRNANLSSFFVDKQRDSVSNNLSQHQLMPSYCQTIARRTTGSANSSPHQPCPQQQQRAVQAAAAGDRELGPRSQPLTVSATSNVELQTLGGPQVTAEARNQQSLFEHLS